MTQYAKSKKINTKEASRPTQATGNWKPVLKKPRRKWIIPRVDAAELMRKQQCEEARLKAIREGTTPHGRELFRHLWWSVRRAFRLGTMTMPQIEAMAAGTIARDALLKPEWALLTARLCRFEPARLVDRSDLFLAKTIVLMALQDVSKAKPGANLGACSMWE